MCRHLCVDRHSVNLVWLIGLGIGDKMSLTKIICVSQSLTEHAFTCLGK